MAVDMVVRSSELVHYCVWNQCCPLNSVVERKYYSDEKIEMSVCEISDRAELARFILWGASSAFDLVANSIRSDCIDSSGRILFWLHPIGYAKQMFRKVSHRIVRSAENTTCMQLLHYLRVELKQGLG